MPRKKPFSGKAKKKQLQEKRERKRNASPSPPSENKTKSTPIIKEEENKHTQSIKSSKKSNKKDLRTIFTPEESREVINERKKDASRYLEYKYHISPYSNGLGQPCNELSMPARPEWTNDMSLEQLEIIEEQTFNKWLTQIYTYNTPPISKSKLNYFEQNIQVWKQLWRVIEKSDILLQVIDARFPIIHFNITLYEHIKKQHGKDMILCINKIDLVSQERLDKWILFFEKYYKGISVCTVSQEQSCGEIRGVLCKAIASCNVIRNGVSLSASSFVYDNETTTSTSALHNNNDNYNDDDDEDTQEEVAIDREKYITIGITGDPNMGKSTLINRLFNKKVVSESSTPGHTKHFQTMFLPSSNNRVCICDSPGVIFPKLHIGREIQILFGLYPISQVREPYTAIRYLAEYLSPNTLPEIYKLVPIDDYGDDVIDVDAIGAYQWSPYRIIESFAKKKQFFIKGGRFDMHRAANYILRDAVCGDRVILSFDPPDYDEYDMAAVGVIPTSTWSLSHYHEVVGQKQQQPDAVIEGNEEYSISSSSASEEDQNVDSTFQLLQIDDDSADDSD